MMTHSRPDIFRWKRFTQNKTPSSAKVQLNNNDIEHWMKRVEKASEFAVAKVFSQKKSHNGIRSQAVALQSTEQLLDHDEAYGEAHSLLNDWMNKKLRLDLEMDEEEDSLIGFVRADNVESGMMDKADAVHFDKFDDMCTHLEQEEESSMVHSFLQDLMESDVISSSTAQELRLDSDREQGKRRDPALSMEVRHRQVKENRLKREAQLEKQRRARLVKREAYEEARRWEEEQQRMRRQEARRQEELLQQEVVRIRREMEDKRSLEQTAQIIEKETQERKKEVQKVRTPTAVEHQWQKDSKHQLKLQVVEARVYMLNLQCIQKHFSAWYSVLLERRLRMGKAAALCDWRRQLRAWRSWRALVWAQREKKEAERTEQELRRENRLSQVATESDRKRLLRRCFSDWRLWRRMEYERRTILAQQEQTKLKMAALIIAAASGNLGAMPPADPPKSEPGTPCKQVVSETATRCRSSPYAGSTLSRSSSQVIQAWQVTRKHAALTASELRRAKAGSQAEDHGSPLPCSANARGGRFEHRHAAQQQTIIHQQKLLREQQEQIAQLREEQRLLALRQQAVRGSQLGHTQHSRPGLSAPHGRSPEKDSEGKCVPMTSRPQGTMGETRKNRSASRNLQTMEERAAQRAERRREVEERKRLKEEERLAQKRAEVEARLREEEENRCIAAERRKEERRRQRERELEKQMRLEKEKKLLHHAGQHYHRTLLLRRGLAPWKSFVAQSQANMQLAMDHHQQSALKQCFLSWQSSARESAAEKEARADMLYERILLRRGLYGWLRMKDYRSILEEQAEEFNRMRTLRKVFLAFLHQVTIERMIGWDLEQKAEQHNMRRVSRSCFQAWRHLPALLKEERVREARREKLRRKVAEILPDFCSSPREAFWGTTTADCL
ncbi:coiled-coil domain-containing protein 191 [Denticeps clupeoides]|uniref:coiled-coil domain-containing protein 191 n=1 Tax=Denticeps clupeoides TaxID=299321 RepID=UPI0010A361B0|nr:coiled-coil domain-containing protein 191 [Denticeps clupeoides]